MDQSTPAQTPMAETPQTPTAEPLHPWHPWHRMVSIGDSFTEGVGDPDDSVPGGFRGWADRVAEELARTTDDFAYANLAIRGRLFQPIVDEQLEPALELKPDLVTISAGGNDMLRPGADPDDIASRLDVVVEQIAATGATVVMFDAADIGNTPVMRGIRGRVAIWNENVRTVAARHDAVLVDLWGLNQLSDPQMWAPDRLHFSPLGHQLLACETLDSLGVDHGLTPDHPEVRPERTWREARRDDMVWARKYFVPWVGRRIRRRSSGDFITAKRPAFGQATIPGAGEEIPQQAEEA
ncbi:SGNH/GDSL hydrolase family protein [Kocuria tytonicola]|uniref:SGNH/GDSL hydrolase family protein n=1 Tax=Kocuria tytonicola TaxID=2055946 RepID=A0A3L9L2B7_9MICC|nr:SGNH/GDSL hydrolase family protein [Kocuria tytonicola]RLY92318.1 SGNH/GDSL hydrolase family protein [Kocuria tytonicola]